MFDKALSDLLKFLYDPPNDEHEQSKDSDITHSSPECSNTSFKNIQIFTDHVMTTKRFQKTLYYGELSHSNFHPPFTLTDATLELFNKTVPNTGRLDILTMDYAASVSRTVCISPYSMVLAMMYLEQLRHKNPDYLESVSPCELFVVSVLVASKYLFDNDEEFTYNCDWAEASNMEVQDLNRLEKDFLDAIKWELFTTQSDFFTFLLKIEQRIAAKRTSQKGWLSYTDICVLSSHKLFFKMCLEISGFLLKAVLVVTVGYVAAVIVVFGAFTVSLMYQKPAEKIIQRIVSHDASSLPFHQQSSTEPIVPTISFSSLYHDHKNLEESQCTFCHDNVECARTGYYDCILTHIVQNLTKNCSISSRITRSCSGSQFNNSYLENYTFKLELMFLSSENRGVSQNHTYSILQT